MGKKTVAISIIVVGVVVAVAISSGWYDQVHQRFTEIDNPRSSSYERFVAPLTSIRLLATAPTRFGPA